MLPLALELLLACLQDSGARLGRKNLEESGPQIKGFIRVVRVRILVQLPDDLRSAQGGQAIFEPRLTSAARQLSSRDPFLPEKTVEQRIDPIVVNFTSSENQPSLLLDLIAVLGPGQQASENQ